MGKLPTRSHKDSPITRIAVVGTCSGQGKTTLARELASKLGGTFVEYDSLQHGPGWSRRSADTIAALLAPVVATERWTVDAIAEKTVGRLVLDRVQLIVWLDLPPWIWFPRLLRRSGRRWLRHEELWNGNRETLRGIFWDRDGVLPWAVRKYFFRRHEVAGDMQRHVLDGVPLVRFTRRREIAAFLASFPA
jgi:adenylate kinase family enzyme